MNNIGSSIIKLLPPGYSQMLDRLTTSDIALALELGLRLIDRVGEIKAQTAIDCSAKILSSDQILPVHLGQTGEAFVEEILSKRWTTSNVSQVNKSGDLTLLISGRKIIVEVKNYTNSVPSAGVDKFYRDLSTTASCAGLFISLKTPITGVTADFTLRFELIDGRTIPCAYLVSAEEAPIIVAINMLTAVLNMRNEALRDSFISGEQINEGLANLARVRNQLQVITGDTVGQLLKTTNNIMSIESGLKAIADKMADDTSFSTSTILHEMEKNQAWSRQKHKNLLTELVIHIEKLVPDDDIKSPSWKLSAKKMTHISGFIINLVAKPELVIASNLISIERGVELLRDWGTKLAYENTFYRIVVDDQTIEMLKDLVGRI